MAESEGVLTREEFREELNSKIQALRDEQLLIGSYMDAPEVSRGQARVMLTHLNSVSTQEGVLIFIATGLNLTLRPIEKPSPEEEKVFKDILDAVKETEKQFQNGREAVAFTNNLVILASTLVNEANERYETATATVGGAANPGTGGTNTA